MFDIRLMGVYLIMLSGSRNFICLKKARGFVEEDSMWYPSLSTLNNPILKGIFVES
jgi:hypothetical protein